MNPLDALAPALELEDVERVWQQAAEAALTLGEPGLLRDLCATMRAHRPHHLEARYYEARVALAEGDTGRAQPLLEGVLRHDPEHWPSRWALGTLLLARNDVEAGLARLREAALRGGTAVLAQVRLELPASTLQRWESFRSATQRPAAEQAQWDDALRRVTEAFGDTLEGDDSPAEDAAFKALQSALLVEALWRSGAMGSAQRLAHKLVMQSPQLIKPRLLLADWLAGDGRVADSVALLHDTRAADPSGQVARRLGLPMLSAALAAPPTEVADLLQRLPDSVRRAVEAGELAQVPAPARMPRVEMKRKRGSRPSPALLEIQQELGKIQKQVQAQAPASARTDLATAEAIVVSREALTKQYGDGNAQAIVREVEALASAVASSDAVRPHVIMLDDAETLKPWKLDRVDPTNAAAVKGLLDRLDERMEGSGQRLAYVLLIGGHDIIPHHRLPNPVEDHDMDVPSDNPYASRGENYLIPTRAVGRLPHEKGSPTLLLEQLRRLQTDWRESALQGKGIISDWLSQFRQWIPGQRRTLSEGESWGMAAQVWEKAAEAVYRTLDSHTALTLCPPESSVRWETQAVPNVPFYYFNLHGVEDGGSWYGQVDPKKPAGGEPFPVALTPRQFEGLDLKRAIVLSEACYGLNPHVTRAADSMALTAVKQGSALYVGSTKTAYASFAPPLMAADLLAALFWRAIAEGATGGLALQQAKVQLAESLMQRTGYLDVEEQKTLTSFILYGDPALPLLRRPSHASTEALNLLAAKTRKRGIYQVAAKGMPGKLPSPEVLESVRAFASPYIQGSRGPLNLRSHPVALSQEPPTTNRFGGTPQAKQVPGRDQWHVTVTHSETDDGVTHRQVLTMTVNKSGKVLRSHMSK